MDDAVAHVKAKDLLDEPVSYGMVIITGCKKTKRHNNLSDAQVLILLFGIQHWTWFIAML